MIMETASVSELKTHLSRFIVLVEQGQQIIVTKDGKPVATISPYQDEGKQAMDHIIKRMKELRKGQRLGGLTYKELRDEGRRY